MARVYSAEFKEEACKRVIEQGESAAVVARELGMNHNTLHTWLSHYRKRHGVKQTVFPGSGRLSPEDERMRRMEQENRELREENAILKKAAAYFARNQK